MSRLLSAIANALTSQWPDETVHFHGGASGAYACHDPRCTSPHLDPND
jgi:hypothetical protein